IQVGSIPRDPTVLQGGDAASVGDALAGKAVEDTGPAVRAGGRSFGGQQQLGADPLDQALIFQDREGRDRDIDTAAAAGNTNDAAAIGQFAAIDTGARPVVDLDLGGVDRSAEQGSSWMRTARAAAIVSPAPTGG